MKNPRPKRYLAFLIFGALILSSFQLKEFNFKEPVISCTEYTEKYTDQLTGIHRFIAKEKLSLLDFEQKNIFDLVWFKTGDEYTLAFKALDQLCFENDIAVSFHLLEGKVVSCSTSHISNCESLMTVNFEDQLDIEQKIEMLISSEVVGISFENRGQTYKLKLQRVDAYQFQQTIRCLRNK